MKKFEVAVLNDEFTVADFKELPGSHITLCGKSLKTLSCSPERTYMQLSGIG